MKKKGYPFVYFAMFSECDYDNIIISYNILIKFYVRRLLAFDYSLPVSNNNEIIDL